MRLCQLFASFDSQRLKEQYIDEINHFDLYIADLKLLLGFMQNAHVTAYDLMRTAMTSMAVLFFM
ncbi:hypothetical protein C1I60_23280 [Paenibacillus terrae]|uniref:Uncharacterized protein n=1 Tax=Paenibacillus terrae TaxID=159743 RepID=A0A4U2PU62_9BACL|nr:hypothetical protein C1I60_23280 [Paenibacillus terrae]